MEEKKFIIDQLRKDKLIYGIEAIAMNAACVLALVIINMFFEGAARTFFFVITCLIGIGYTLYMGMGNFYRLKKIQEIEKELGLEISFYVKPKN